MSPKFQRHIAALAVFLAAACLPLRAGAQGYGQGDEDPEVRIDRLENQLRTLTGQNEELQHRNQVLEEQLRALQGGAPGGQAPVQAARPGGPPPQQQTYQQQPYQQQPSYQPQQGRQGQPAYNQSQSYNGGAPAPIAQPEGAGGRRGDAFDPTQNPSAPGAPRALGGGQMPITPGAPVNLSAPPPAGGYQQPDAAPQQGGYPQQSNASLETLPPSQTPKDEFDLGIGYMERKDYASAEDTMRNFLQKYPSDRLIADAQYWLGESLYQRQRYRDAAESFLAVTTKYDKSNKAPDALLRLGQSLAALKEKDAACAAFGEVTRKYPRASSGVKQGAEREQKRVGC